LASPTPIIHSTQTPVGRIADLGNTSVGTAAWPAANRAIYVPFVVEAPVTVVQVAWENGATLNGNVDVGIYDLAGTRLVSLGSTAQAGASVAQAGDITDRPLNPGVYYMAMASSSATATFARVSPTIVGVRAGGVLQQDTAFALPTTATFAVATASFLPMFALITQAVI
jgi:hypothetical protein